MHSCGATCAKYSYKSSSTENNASQTPKGRPPCRFHAPWILREQTRFTEDGILHIRRDHARINRYCPALAVSMRHNTDTAFLPTSSAGLSMVYYATNYSTKLDSPLWKRAALVKTVLEGISERVDEDAHQPQLSRTDANNKARQFLARTANQIFTSRELSAVEVCSRLLNFESSYCSEQSWVYVTMNTLYWAVFRIWPGLAQGAGPDVQHQQTAETMGLRASGPTLTALQAYRYRGQLLQDLCFYEYLCLVKIHRLKGYIRSDKAQFVNFDSTPDNSCSEWIQEVLPEKKRCVPVITGYLDHDANGTQEGYYQR